MKRTEMLAWSALAGLLTIALILLCGGALLQFTAFWAAMMLALGQALVVGLAAWGMMLARQSAELSAGPAIGGFTPAQSPASAGFRMTMGGDESKNPPPAPSEARTLDIGFQRLLIGTAGVILAALGIISGYLVYRTVAWARANPDQPFPIAGTLPLAGLPFVPLTFTELAVVIGLGAAGIYAILYWVTRPRRETDAAAENLHGIFLLGLGGIAALAVATILAYLRVSYASDLAAAIIAGLMLLQGLELLVNSLRSYSGIEELDQEAVDLQATPITPMLGSVWLNGLKMLVTQSVGLSTEQRGQRGVIARMMPRALLAILLIAIAASCLRVVAPGEVAILERLGTDNTDPNDGRPLPSFILQPGLHLTFPWPIDELVRIPTQTLQFTDVGAQVHGTKGADNVEYQFWTVGLGNIDPAQEENSRFITGDQGGQILETYVGIWWRVADPAQFYTHLSHSDFYERGAAPGTEAIPIYEALIQQSASFAVTRTFSIHSLDQVMIQDRKEVAAHCKRILQDKLNEAGSGIEIADLTIEDLHPPFYQADQPDSTQWDGLKHGPAAAFESVVKALEFRQRVINMANRDKIQNTKQAEGQASNDISQARAYGATRVATAQGDSARVASMITGDVARSPELQDLAKRLAAFRELSDTLAPVNKILVDPRVDVQFIQSTDRGVLPLRPLGQ